MKLEGIQMCSEICNDHTLDKKLQSTLTRQDKTRQDKTGCTLCSLPVCKILCKPKLPHEGVLKYVVHYLKGPKDEGIILRPHTLMMTLSVT